MFPDSQPDEKWWKEFHRRARTPEREVLKRTHSVLGEPLLRLMFALSKHPTVTPEWAK